MGDWPKVSVVVCAYTVDRWPSLSSAIEGALLQVPGPVEVLVVVDTDELVERVRSRWPDSSSRVCRGA